MIDYFYSIKITNSESVSEFSELKKLKTATYDMSSIIKHEIQVKTYKDIRRRRSKKNIGDWVVFLFLAFLGPVGPGYKSIAWDEKVADDRGITTEEVKKCYLIVKESDWVNFNKMISKKVNDEIQKFKQLFDYGVISQEEFEKKKNELLNL
jgi:hypothetical protein